HGNFSHGLGATFRMKPIINLFCNGRSTMNTFLCLVYSTLLNSLGAKFLILTDSYSSTAIFHLSMPLAITDTVLSGFCFEIAGPMRKIKRGRRICTMQYAKGIFQ